MRAIFRDARLQQQFERDGYVVVDLLGREDIGRLSQLHQRSAAGITGSNAWSYTSQSQDAAYRRTMSEGICAVLEPRIDTVLDRCRSVIGNFFYKQASSVDSKIHMHQDWTWVDESRHHSLSVWCPCQPVDPDNGTLAVIPGSHLLSTRPRAFVSRFPYDDLVPVLSEKYSRHLTLAAGQAVFFHQRLFHWSGPNLAAAPRLAAACLVIPAEAEPVFPYGDPPANPRRIEFFEVTDALLYSFVPGVRPQGARRVGELAAAVEPLDEAALERLLGSHRGPALAS